MTSPVLDQEVAESVPRIGPRRAPATWLARAAARGAIPIAAFAAAYLAETSVIAARKPLWNDELYTYHFTRVSSLADLWRALETGADQAPPLSYLFTRATFSMLGVGRFTIRLPEIIAFLVFCLCLYAFVKRRTNQIHGLIAMLLPTLTGAYYYASEARAYALVLAFGALALVCWQLATEGVRRRATIFGLALTLFLATSSHYYAVLLLVPLGLGELARTLIARRLDVAVWVAFAGALLPLAAFIQLVRASRNYSAAFWARPSWHDPLGFFSFLFHTTLRGRLSERDVVLLVIVVAALALLVLSPRGRWLESRARVGPLIAATLGLPLAGLLTARLATGVPVTGRELSLVGAALLVLAGYLALRAGSSRPLLAGPPMHEVVAAGAFLLIPLAAVLVAKTATHAYTARYALPAVIGFVILPLALYRLEGSRPIVGLSVVAALAIAFLVASVPRERAASRSSTDQRRTFQFLEHNAPARRPILIDDSHQYLELSYSPPPSLAGRLIYVADPQRDATQNGLFVLGQIASLRVYDRKEGAALRGPLLALSPRGAADWTTTKNRWSILPTLRAQGRSITTKAVYGDQALYEISVSAP